MSCVSTAALTTRSQNRLIALGAALFARSNSFAIGFVALFACVGTPSLSSGQTSYSWNVTSGGAWTTTTNWSGGSTYPGKTSGTYDVATFGIDPSGGYTVTLGSTVYLNTISFTQTDTTAGNSYTIASGGTLDLGGTSPNSTPTINVTTSGVSAAINSAIAGTAFQITGAGNLTLGGTVNISNANLTMNGSGALTLDGTVSDNITLVVNSGTVILDKTNTSPTVNAVYAGLTINGGTVQISPGNGAYQIKNSSAVTINSGGTFDLDGNANTLIAAGIRTTTAGGVITNSSAGTTATLTIGTVGGTDTFQGTIQDGASGTGKIALIYAGVGTEGYTQTLTGPISISGGLTNSSTGILAIAFTSASVNSTFGSLTLGGFSGALIGNNAAQSAGNLQATITVTGAASAADVLNAGPLTVNAGGSSITATPGSSGTMTISLGAITRNVGGTVSFSSTGTFTTTTPFASANGFATVGTTEWAVTTGGSSPFTISGLATGGGSFSGGGDVDVAAGTTSPTGSPTINSLRFINTTTASSVALTGTLTIASGGILISSVDTTGAAAISGGTLTANAGQDLVVIQNAPATNTAGLTISSQISGSGGLTKSGVGLLILSNTGNNFTGPTYINNGTLQFGANNALPATTNVTLASTFPTAGSTVVLNLNSFSGTIASLSGGAGGLFSKINVTLGTGTLTIAGSTNATFYGIITSTGGGLTMAGTGTQTLAGLNTYTGATTINSGTLAVTVAAAGNYLPNNSAATVAFGGGVLEFNSTFTGAQTFGGGITINQGANHIVETNTSGNTMGLGIGSASTGITRNTGGTLDFYPQTSTTSNTFSTYAPNSASTILGGYATYNNYSTWAVSAGSGSASGAITGLATASYSASFAANVNVDAPLGTSTPGPITINSLRFNTAGTSNPGYVVNTTGALVIASGGILETSNVGNYTVAINNNTLTSGNGQDLIIIQNNASGSSATLTINSQIIDNSSTSIAVTKSGAGVAILTAANSYSGGTFVNSGTLIVANTLSSGTGSGAVNVTGGTLGGNGTILSSNAVTINSGGTITGGTVVGAGSTGAFTITSSAAVQISGVYSFNLNKAGSSAGLNTGGSTPGLTTTNHDILVINGLGGLTFNAGSTLNITITDASASSSQSYSWLIATSTGTITGLPTIGTLTATGTNFAGVSTAAFSLDASGTNLYLNYTASTPEPRHVLLIAAIGTMLLVGIARRYRKAAFTQSI